MSDCKIYPADTVDAAGKAWPTVGENIRNGLFGAEVKKGVINIDGQNTASQELTINIVNNGISVKEKVLLLYPISCSSGYLSFRISLTSKETILVPSVDINTIKGKIGVLYTEN